MIGLSKLLKEHGAAINADLMASGWRRADIGVRFSWGDFKDWFQNLSPTGESAYYRAIKPRSWWVTPEYVATKELMYAVELGNWQRAGGKKGHQPKPPKIPSDGEVHNITPEEISDKRRAQREHLAKARASRGPRKTTKKSINPGKGVSRGA